MITKKVLLAHICDIYTELDAIEEKLEKLAAKPKAKPATEGEKRGRGRPKGSKNKAK